jgi:hypothetical protein
METQGADTIVGFIAIAVSDIEQEVVATAHPERNGQESYSQHPRQAACAAPRRGRRTHARERFAVPRRSVSAACSPAWVSARRDCRIGLDPKY